MILGWQACLIYQRNWNYDKQGSENKVQYEYAKTVVIADFEEAGHEDVVRKVAADLEGKSTADEIRAKRAELLAVAKDQIMKEA